MTAKIKPALVTLLLLGTASAAQAAVPCPALEGYPDCHPDSAAVRETAASAPRALWLRAEHQTVLPAAKHHMQRFK